MNEPSPGKSYHLLTLIGRGGLIITLWQSAGCRQIQDLQQNFLDHRTPRERYEEALQTSGLTETALGRDWLHAGEQALRHPAVVRQPHEETGFLPPSEPTALGYTMEVPRGQIISLNLALSTDSSTRVFLDAWEVLDDSTGTLQFLAAADSGERSLSIEPRRTIRVIFRVQVELLRGGRYRAAIRHDPALAFPVSGRREYDIGSRFGAPRDGGVRDHHGIDIFAPRGTPVVAGRNGTVTRVETTPRGGRVVWVRDETGHSLYYAHLDSQLVATGQFVVQGETLGLVGNSGNARTTPPHLHFGIYRRGEGPLDPWWFVNRLRGASNRLTADTTRIGEWVRTDEASAFLLTGPHEAPSTTPLPRHTPAQVIAATGRWYRIRLPDGSTGFIAAAAVEPASTVIASETINNSTAVLTRPSGSESEEAFTTLRPGESLEILARYRDLTLIRTGVGAAGWITDDNNR